MRGGEFLERLDQLRFKLKAPGKDSARGRFEPIENDHPFATWKRGEVVAHHLLVDLRLVSPGKAALWLSVVRGQKRLEVTSGAGAFAKAARPCTFEVTKP